MIDAVKRCKIARKRGYSGDGLLTSVESVEYVFMCIKVVSRAVFVRFSLGGQSFDWL